MIDEGPMDIADPPGGENECDVGEFDRVRRASPIVEVIGEYVDLVRCGAAFKGRCPFHPEKRPSFYVHPVHGFFHCFGCQASGDVFAFEMRRLGRGMSMAIQSLKDRAESVRRGREEARQFRRGRRRAVPDRLDRGR